MGMVVVALLAARSGTSGRDDHGDAPPDEVSRQLRQLIHLIVGEAVFDRDVLTFDVTRLLETLAKSAQLFAERIRRLAMEDPDYRHRRLRARHERPRNRRAAEKRDELAPSHVHSSSRGSHPTTLLSKRRCASQQNGLPIGGYGSWTEELAASISRPQHFQ
jgi:hypothetical protein